MRYLSIHAHFYQPPREDPFTGKIPTEIGAAPFLNWNERIHAECYRPNAELHNFERISFNIGPTLSNWMEQHDPDTHHQIIEQDRLNVRRYGVGNAMAQGYNHVILPLASWRDKVTQVAWGIADFEHRYGRRPQGMWLPETAVDIETLEALVLQGIEFTILAPWQVDEQRLDTTQPYIVRLSSGRKITVFFYQRELSSRVSFDANATTNADLFVNKVLQSYYHQENGAPQLILIASDGELYGHHQALRDRFLARLVDGASSQVGIQPIYPALWLQHFSPRQEVVIRERTSWSCHHGVGRWLGQCPCTPGDRSWKAQLRYALERLADEIDRLYLDVTREYFDDPWLTRDRYIHVMLKKYSIDEFLRESANSVLTSQQAERAHLMLEAQRERQRMFTSCGWYFEDFDRIEPKNNVAYAAQAMILARRATGIDFTPMVLADLQRVTSQRTKLPASAVFRHHLQRAEQ